MRRAAHTHTPHCTLHPATRRPRRPTAPPRWERDEEMEQPEGEASNTYLWEGKLCATLFGVSHYPGQPRPYVR